MSMMPRWMFAALTWLVLSLGVASSAMAEGAFRVAQFEEDSAVGWTALEIATTADSDGDGATDAEEGDGDRDNDGIPNKDDYDPTGYFYDQADGRILSGGGITVTPSAGVNIVSNGNTGFYQFFVSSPGVYTINMTPPPGYTLADKSCPRQDPPPFDTPDSGGPVILGFSEVGNTGFLQNNVCTDYYFTFDIPVGSVDVFMNNFPFVAVEPISAPAASSSTLLAMVASLLLFGAWRLVRRARHQD